MSASAPLRTLLLDEFVTEASAGFPLLGKLPKTRIVQLVDYYETLPSDGRSAFLEALASRAAAALQGQPAPSPPAFAAFWTATTTQSPFTGGFRYCDVKAIASISKLPQFGGMQGWAKQTVPAGGRALQPREDLLPDGNLELLVPAKAPLLKKLVDSALKGAGFTKLKTPNAGGETRYSSDSGVEVRLDFASRFMGQLRYTVSTAAGGPGPRGWSLEETFWSQPGGWDYLTEENAPRCIALLPEVVARLAGLAEKLGPAG